VPLVLRVVGAVIIHQVRRIGGKQDGPLALHQTDDIVRLGTVAAEQAMRVQDPEIAWTGNGITRRFGNGLFFFRFGVIFDAQQVVEFGCVEAGHLQVEVHGAEFFQFDPQQLLVPLGPSGGAVGQQAKGFDLRLRQLVGQNHRHLSQFQPP